jgi:Spy/CpxP family protein refolding chaperone
MFILLTTVVLFSFNSNIFAQMRGGQNNPIKDDLNLTEEQEQQMNTLRYEHQKIVLDKKNEIEKNRLEIRNMMVTNNINPDLLKSLIKKNSDIQAELKQIKIEHWLDVYNLLDDTQKEIWVEHFERMDRPDRGMKKHMRHPEMRERRQGSGPGMDRKGF